MSARVKIDEATFQRYLKANPTHGNLGIALSWADEVHSSCIVKAAVASWWITRAAMTSEPVTREDVHALIAELFSK